MKIKVTQEFIDQCYERAEIYNPGTRSKEQLLRDIECEIFEYHMIKTDQWDSHDSWKVDGVSDVYGNVDVKFVHKYYNIAHKKMAYLAWQATDLETFLFVEWVSRPDRLLKAGDEVEVRIVGYLSYMDFLKNVRPSHYNNGYYVDVRKVAQPYEG